MKTFGQLFKSSIWSHWWSPRFINRLRTFFCCRFDHSADDDRPIQGHEEYWSNWNHEQGKKTFIVTTYLYYLSLPKGVGITVRYYPYLLLFNNFMQKKTSVIRVYCHRKWLQSEVYGSNDVMGNLQQLFTATLFWNLTGNDLLQCLFFGPNVEVMSNYLRDSDWLKLITWVATSNQSAVFQHIIVPLLRMTLKTRNPSPSKMIIFWCINWCQIIFSVA